MSTNYSTNPFVNVSDAEMYQYILDGYMSTKTFIEPVKVIAVDTERKEVDVLPLIAYPARADNSVIDNKPIYGLPIFQLQRGTSAIIMMPVVGDIGLIAICDGNIESIKTTKTVSVAQNARRHSRSDGIYLGGIFNATPTQFIEFTDNAINITSPNLVNIEAPNVNIKATTISMQGETTLTGNLTVKGNITSTGDVADSVGKLSELRDNYNKHTHQVSGVESGGSTVTTGAPN